MFVKALCLTFGFFTEFCILDIIIYLILDKIADPRIISYNDKVKMFKLAESTAKVFTLMSIILYLILMINKG